MKISASLLNNIKQLPADLQRDIWRWILTPRELVSFVAEGSGLLSYKLSPPSPEQSLLFESPWFEDPSYSPSPRPFPYPRIQDLSPEEKAVIVTFTFGPVPDRSDHWYHPLKPSTNKLRWIVQRWRGVNTYTQIQKRFDHCYKSDWQSQALFGARYQSRLIRGSKVLCIRGKFQGKHGVVVSHSPESQSEGPSRKLDILLANQVIEQELQNNLKLLDPQGYLPFAIPFDPEHPVQEYHWGRDPEFACGILQRDWYPHPAGPIDIFEPKLHIWDEIQQEGQYTALLNGKNKEGFFYY